MQVCKWGNSLAVRLPASVVEALELKEGDDIEIHVAGERAFVVSRTPDRQAPPEAHFRPPSGTPCLWDALRTGRSAIL